VKQPNALAVWLYSQGLSSEQFARAMAEQLGHEKFSTRTVEKWRAGERVPRGPSMRAIMVITDGAVTANDFVEGV
jgi:DNA-binding transcriptional regulator YiaG